MDIFFSSIFWLSPVALIIHLALTKEQSKADKLKVAYLYGSLWAIALIYYLARFLSDK
ncbi:MAG: hypothetical protein ACFCU5_06720 [Pleurocapsa sp.]